MRNAVARTDAKWDGMVKHLGYEPISRQDASAAGITMTDVELIRASQERMRGIKVIPDSHLGVTSLTHLEIARVIARRIFPYSPPGVHAAVIPGASDRVRTAGLYSTSRGEVYISTEQLPSLSSVIDTLVHELAHHRQYQSYHEADDLTPGHKESMRYIAAEVVKITDSGELDHLFKEATW